MQMKTTKKLWQSGVLTLSLLATSVMAAVSPDEAAKLGNTLTPVGAEMAGNASGTIPAWTGGLPANAGAVDPRGFLADPFANEQPLFTITAQNVDQYKDKLTPVNWPCSSATRTATGCRSIRLTVRPACRPRCSRRPSRMR